MMAKHEPWFKPRDEDQDDALIDWLGAGGKPPAKGKSCPLLLAIPAVAVGVLLISRRRRR
jgi:hypothetical protein